LHQALLNTIRAKDLATAEATLTEHILDAQRRACEALQRARSAHSE
jgi:DNA-binding GntR family transcriptional regulator